MKKLLGISVLVALAHGYFAQNAAYREGVVIFKVKPEHRVHCSPEAVNVATLQAVFDALKPIEVFQKFPQNRPTRAAQKSHTDISLIYEMHYATALDAAKAAQMLMSSGALVYAEPAYVAQLIEVPNDALVGKQWHLINVRAFEAWDVVKGSPDILIAIVDTGVDWKHPDLTDAIHYNEDDPIDGVDNDGNGFVDDYRGWNFYDGNNDPMELSWSHGTHVCGLAGAVANNGIFGAGTSYGSQVLPVKAGHQLSMTHGYEGIVYAVEMGADIINCSWGSVNYSAFGHDIVRHATEAGALIVCGAGNNNNDKDFYPGAFNETLNVCATDSNNYRADFASYYYNVDMAAPGRRIVSSKNDGKFEEENGSSMSSPIVAGAAAVVKTRFPHLTPAQIKAQLVNTTANIYDLEPNQNYIDRLGTGLLDMRAAVDSLRFPAVELDSYALTDDSGDEAFFAGETGRLGVSLVNWLGTSGDLTVILTSLDTLVKVRDAVRHFSAMGEGERVNNFDNPFVFELTGKRLLNKTVDLRLTLSDGKYTRNEYLRFLVNPDYVNVAVNDIATTVGSAGQVGFADIMLVNGLGFRLAGTNLLYEAGLMIGARHNGVDKVLDRVRGEHDTDRDFWPVEFIVESTPENSEAFFAQGVFNDTSANLDEIGVSVAQRTWAFDKDGHRNYMVVEYTIRNDSDVDLNDVFVGVFADWDIANPIENRGKTVFGKRLAAVYGSGENQPWAGVQSLTDTKPFISHMLDNSGRTGSVDISFASDGFTSAEKWKTLRTNQQAIGQDSAGVDVSHVVASGGYHLPRGAEITVAFAFMAAESKAELLRAADSAYKQYNGYLPGHGVFAPFQLVSVAPNPTNGPLRVEFSLRGDADLQFSFCDMSGIRVSGGTSGHFYAGANIVDLTISALPSGTYVLNVTSPTGIARSFLVSYQKP